LVARTFELASEYCHLVAEGKQFDLLCFLGSAEEDEEFK
jgi:hypothetical protein